MSEAAEAILARFGLTAAPEQLARIAAFFELRARWAKAHNLSGPRALREPVETDLADAAALAALAGAEQPIVDVGAGSGVPSALTALLRPDLRLRAVEPLAKRAAFLRQAAATLGLAHLQVSRESWPLALAEPTQIVSRAVFPVAEWPRRAAEGGPQVAAIYRYLARERPDFDATGFHLDGALDYAGPGGAAHRLERWRRT